MERAGDVSNTGRGKKKNERQYLHRTCRLSMGTGGTSLEERRPKKRRGRLHGQKIKEDGNMRPTDFAKRPPQHIRRGER